MKKHAQSPAGIIASLEKRLAEAEVEKGKLIAENALLRQLYEQAPLSYQSLDENGFFLFVNQAWIDTLGYRREEVVGHHFSEFLHPDWKDHFRENFPRFKSIGEILGVEFEMVRKDGSIVLVSFHGKIGKNTQGGFERQHCLFQDITESRQIEEEYKRFFELVPDMMCIASVDGYFHKLNGAWSSVLGYSEEELQSVSFFDFVHPDDREATVAENRKLIAGKPVANFTNRYRHKDGSYRWFEWHATPADKSGSIFAVARNITERKQAEEQTKTSLAEKEVLLKEIHHRVKNNLQVISSLISLQAGNLTDERIRDELNDVSDRVRSMALVHEKLYQNGNLAQLNFADYAVSMLGALWRSYSVQAGNIRLHLALAPVALPIEKAVPCGLILNELAVNALKHAFPESSGGEITVGLEHNPDSNTVSLWVRDNGVGLPPGADWRQCSSLGLRLVDILTSQLRGALEIGSGPGAEFRVTFPLSGLYV
jgi:PAS domain S-box-containing protein